MALRSVAGVPEGGDTTAAFAAPADRPMIAAAATAAAAPLFTSEGPATRLVAEDAGRGERRRDSMTTLGRAWGTLGGHSGLCRLTARGRQWRADVSRGKATRCRG